VIDALKAKAYQFNLSVLGDHPQLKSTADLGFTAHVETSILQDFEELINVEKFRNQGGKKKGCVRHQGGPLWSLRGYSKGERLVLYQIGSSLYSLIHFARKEAVVKGKLRDIYTPMMNGFIAVFLYFQYGITPTQI